MFQLSRLAEEDMNAFSPTTSGPGFGARLGASNFGQNLGANMATPQAMTQMASGIGGIIQGLVGRGKRRDAQIAAQAERDKMMKRYENLDTSNLYADVENPFAENVYEDLTVNQQQAQFEAQQTMQATANIMSGLQGAAGSSGIAGLAQALANQSQLATQRASASVGAQEAMNQQLKAKGAMQKQKGEMMAQQMRLAGAETARGLEWQKTGTQLGMAQQDLAAKNQAIAQANAALYGGIGDVVGTVATAAISDRRLKKNINLIGKSPSGLNIYNFEYIDPNLGEGVYQGVMSDEVPSKAVVYSNGYDAVDYSLLDVEFKRIN